MLFSPQDNQIMVDKTEVPPTQICVLEYQVLAYVSLHFNLLFAIFISHTALKIHVSQSTINILQRTDCQFEYEPRGETFLKVRVRIWQCYKRVNSTNRTRLEAFAVCRNVFKKVCFF